MTATPDTEWLDRSFLEAAASIERHGFTNFCIGYGVCACPECDCPDIPNAHPWSYTVGFHRIDQPELVMMGLPMRHVNCVSSAVFELARSNEPMEVGPHVRHEIHPDLTIALIPVPDRWLECDRCRMAAWFAHFGSGEHPGVLQAVWADADGRMPWELDVPSALSNRQPVLIEDPVHFPTPPRTRPVGRTAKRRRR